MERDEEGPRRLVSGRLPDDVWQTLEAIRYLEERAALSDLVEDVLVEYTRRRSGELEVRAARESKAQYHARKSGKLTHLGAGQKSGRKKS